MAQKITGRAVSPVTVWVKAAAGGLLWTALGGMAAAWMVDREWIAMESIGYISMAVWLTAGWLVSSLGKGKAQEQQMAQGLIALGIYFLGLLGMNALFFGGKFTGVWITLLLLLLGWGLSQVLTGKGRVGGRKRYKIPK